MAHLGMRNTDENDDTDDEDDEVGVEAYDAVKVPEKLNYFAYDERLDKDSGSDSDSFGNYNDF